MTNSDTPRTDAARSKCRSLEDLYGCKPLLQCAYNLERELCALRQTSGEPVAAWLLPNDSINSIQAASIQKLISRAKHAHYCNIYLRINGKDEEFQADWIKYLRAAQPAPATTGAWGPLAGNQSESPAPAVLADMVLVPREPTPEMIQAGGEWFMACRSDSRTTEWQDAKNIYTAMLAAAQEPKA